MPRSRKKAYSSQNVSSVSNLTINRAALLPNTADFADRLFAYLIDLFLLLLLLGIYYVSLGSNTPNIIEAIIAGGVFFGYFFAFTFFGNGQTLGQYVLKLQTVPATFTEDHFVIEKNSFKRVTMCFKRFRENCVYSLAGSYIGILCV